MAQAGEDGALVESSSQLADAGLRTQLIAAMPYPILLRGLLIILMATARFVPGRRARYTFALAPHPMSSSIRQPITRLPMRLSGRFAPPPSSVGAAAMRACGARAERRLIHDAAMPNQAFCQNERKHSTPRSFFATNRGLRLPDGIQIVRASAIPCDGLSANKSGIWNCPSGVPMERRHPDRETNLMRCWRRAVLRDQKFASPCTSQRHLNLSKKSL